MLSLCAMCILRRRVGAASGECSTLPVYHRYSGVCRALYVLLCSVHTHGELEEGKSMKDAVDADRRAYVLQYVRIAYRSSRGGGPKNQGE